MVTVVDLASKDLAVVGQLELPTPATMARVHPDDKHVIVGGGPAFHFVTVEDGEALAVGKKSVKMGVMAFDISANGKSIIATGWDSMFEFIKPPTKQKMNAKVFDVEGTDISLRRVVAESGGKFDRPFSVAMTPGGSALVVNGLGFPSGELDDVLVVDVEKSEPAVSGVVPQISDGMESVEVHPSGDFAVVACLGALGEESGYASCLATIDLATTSPRLLNHLPLQHYPEGLEFSPDGRHLFVGAMFADRIVVFDVEDNGVLRRRPYVIHTGRLPASMAVSSRYSQ